MANGKALVLPRRAEVGDPVLELLAAERLRVRIRELEIALADATDYAAARLLGRTVHGYLVHACRRLGVRVRYHAARWPA